MFVGWCVVCVYVLLFGGLLEAKVCLFEFLSDIICCLGCKRLLWCDYQLDVGCLVCF